MRVEGFAAVDEDYGTSSVSGAVELFVGVDIDFLPADTGRGAQSLPNFSFTISTDGALACKRDLLEGRPSGGV